MAKPSRKERILVENLSMFAGLVSGANGRGGSGTCVELKDGSIALLTAKHVVFDCLRATGRIAISAYGIKFQEPQMIRMDSSQQGDAAFLVLKDLSIRPKAVPFDEWTRNRIGVAVGQRVLACGFPGVLRNVEGRIVSPTFAWVGDRVQSITSTRVVSGINEKLAGIPTSLKGMSGGGLFSEQGEFIGVIVGERRRVASGRGELHSLQPSAFAELYTPFMMPEDAPPGGFYSADRKVAIVIHTPDGIGTVATVGCLAQCFWSKTNPNHKHGRVGRLVSLEFVIPGIDTRYPINIESMFTWSGETEDDMMNAIQEEFRFLLLRLGWLLSDGPDGQSRLQINPMN